MPKLPARLPTPLSGRGTAQDSLYSQQGRECDVAVGGIPFRLATTSDLPQSTETIAVRKEQFDTEADPGEQSLSGFWRRSQSSFHSGAGYTYEPARSEEDFTGFYDSSGVDIFTPGRLTLLRKLGDPLTAGESMLKVRNRGGFGGVIGNTSGDLYEVSGASLVLLGACHDLFYSDYIPGAARSDDLMVSNAGRVYKGDPGTVTATDYWQLTTTPPKTSYAVPQMMWAKYRLWVIAEGNIWQPDVSGTPDGGAAPINPIFTNPQWNFWYTCMAEGPSAVYFGGNDGEESSIQSITLDESGGLPTLSGATTAAVLPAGELVRHLAVVAGQYVGIGTTQGFRVGRIESNGSITYGPLLLSRATTGNEDNSFYGTFALTTRGDSFIVALRDDTVAARTYQVNTAFEVEPLVFAYARDVEVAGVATGTYFQSLDVTYGATYGPSRVVGVLSTGDYYEQSEDEFVETGWLETSRIRFHTTEPKAFKYLAVRPSELPTGTAVQAEVVVEGGSALPIASISTLAQGSEGYPIDLGPAPYVSIRLTLVGATTSSPEVESLLLRALPAVAPQRLLTLPLLCFDYEQARSGHRYGEDGYSRLRLRALQAFEDEATTVTYQDFSDPDRIGVLCVIESMRFVQTSPPSLTRQEGAGGILLLQLRTVTP